LLRCIEIAATFPCPACWLSVFLSLLIILPSDVFGRLGVFLLK
jgi:hypothetical protein